jgi:hypothetical protein
MEAHGGGGVKVQLHSINSTLARVSGQPYATVALTLLKEPPDPLNRRLRGHQSQCGRFGDEKNLLPPPGIEHDSSVVHPLT